jgi:hypothetical protein
MNEVNLSETIDLVYTSMQDTLLFGVLKFIVPSGYMKTSGLLPGKT